MARKTRPRLPVAILWHQHQPFYRTHLGGDPRGAYLLPWVRLHAVRDYYAMAALVAEHPNVHVTFNLVPSLMAQLDDYVENGATDEWMELSLKPLSSLSGIERDFILARFFDADWGNEIRIHKRYAQLLRMRKKGRSFSDGDLNDLRMWYNLAWFPPETRQGTWTLPDGDTVSVARYVDRGTDFTDDDIEAVLAEQLKLVRNVIPLHRALMDEGRIEVSVTPFYHPILPILADSDRANIDAHDCSLPPRFHRPEDARAQIERAVAFYEEKFGRPPAGMWPSEGSVGEHVVDLVHEAGFKWWATDRGVLEMSGAHGYETEDPEVLLRPYLAGKPGRQVSTFFRHTRLSDDIGFSMQSYPDYDRAAEEYLGWIREGFARRVKDPGDRVLSIILDGENAWGSYRNSGRAFLRGLYRRLNDDPELVTVTFSEFIDGNEERGVRAHPSDEQYEVSPLYAASWIDEMGSPHGNDLNIWIGSPEENRAWELLGQVRDRLEEAGATPSSHPEAYESLYVAEGSDWFWWFGDDFVLPPGGDWMFDWLFRERLKDVYRGLGEEPPAVLEEPIVRGHATWSEDASDCALEPGQALRVLSPRPGSVRFTADGWATSDERPLEPAGDVMARLAGYAARLGPFDGDVGAVQFEFLTEGGGGASVVHSVSVLARESQDDL
ncbi:MAG: glycoside hydrolase family 57 protein [Candidatus Eisenbacteria bacterium]